MEKEKEKDFFSVASVFSVVRGPGGKLPKHWIFCAGEKYNGLEIS